MRLRMGMPVVVMAALLGLAAGVVVVIALRPDELVCSGPAHTTGPSGGSGAERHCPAQEGKVVAGTECGDSIAGVVSNAMISVGRILESGEYRKEEFGRSVWLTAEDEQERTVWRLFPGKSNDSLVSVESIVHLDAARTQRDEAKSFHIQFDPDSGHLRSFAWGDKHEVLLVLTNGMVDYARDLGSNVGLVMRRDSDGHVVSSNIYNWARRGRVIGGQESVPGLQASFGPDVDARRTNRVEDP